MTAVFLGLDLGWTTGATGLAAVDNAGRLVASGRVRDDHEIAAWVGDTGAQPVVVAVDAPLIVPNKSGMRVPERLIGKKFGAFGASAHTSNTAKFGHELPRAMQLAGRFGWVVDPTTPSGAGQTVCIEVYPHPAIVGLFDLGYRLDYKKGNDERRAPGFDALMSHLESIPELVLGESPRWTELRALVAQPKPGDLNRVEDELDAILCAHLAWLWHHRREALHVYGSLEDGYIVATPPPTHKAVPPAKAAAAPPIPTTLAGVAFDAVVAGRPDPNFGASVWKDRVREAFAECVLPQDCRVQVEADFVLGADQLGPNEPDLDNLIKSTIDALEGLLGRRPGTGARLEADDVRVARIVASKRPARSGEKPGGHLVVSEVADLPD